MSNNSSALIRALQMGTAEPDLALLDRYATNGDEAAFAVLVERHGPLVLGTCRRALRDSTLAEDAFQATFLVLARQAAKAAKVQSLSSWLFGVARRVAHVARRTESRRIQRERRYRSILDAAPTPTPSDWDEMLRQLDEELEKLPDKYRAPLLACYLHGRTQDEAARELGWSLSTLRRRLEHGRALLKARLTARGAALTSGLIAGALAPSADAAVSDVLRQKTLAIVQAWRQGSAITGIVGALAMETSKMSIRVKIGMALGAFVLMSALVLTQGFSQAPPDAPKASPKDSTLPEAKRDRFNDPLPPNAIARMGTVAFKHPGADGLAYSRDGKILVSRGQQSLSVWNAETGQELTRLGRQGNPVDDDLVAAALSGDGTKLFMNFARIPAPRDFHRSFVVWDIGRAQQVSSVEIGWQEPKPSRGPHIFAPNGAALAELIGEGDVWLWDGNGKATHILRNVFNGTHSDLERQAAFTPDGKTLITCDPSHLVMLWDVNSGQVRRSFGGSLPAPMTFAQSANGNFLATIAPLEAGDNKPNRAQADKKIRVWDLSTGKVIREITCDVKFEQYEPLFMTFTPDNLSIVLADNKDPASEVRQWRISDGKQTADWRFSESSLRVGSLAIDPTSRTLAVGTRCTIQFFDLNTGKPSHFAMNVHRGCLRDAAFSANGRELGTVGDDGTFRTWDTNTGQPKVIGLSDGGVHFSPDGSSIIYGERSEKSGLVDYRLQDDFASGLFLKSIRRASGALIYADDKIIWTISDDWKTLKQFSFANGKETQSFPIDMPEAVYPITADSHRFVAASDDGKHVAGWDLANGKKLFDWSPIEQKLFPGEVFRGKAGLTRIAMSRDGRLLAVIIFCLSKSDPNDEMRLSLCELSTGKIVWQAKGQDFGINQTPAFSPDGKLLATGGPSIRVFDVASGKEIAEFKGHRGDTTVLRFSPDSRKLVSGGDDGNAIVWKIPNRD